MADLAASVGAGETAAAGDYPTLFANYVVRSAETLQRRLATGGAFSQEEFARQRSHALHVLTFALGPDDAWPAARLAVHPRRADGAGRRPPRLDSLPHARIAAVRRWRIASPRPNCPVHRLFALRLTSDFDAAQQWLAAALHTFRALGDDAGAKRTLNQLAYVDCLLHRPTPAQERRCA